MAGTTTIADVRVFDGSSRTPPTTVVVTDGRITSVDLAPDAADTNGELVDGSGATLLPGLIDTHVHVDDVRQLEAAGHWGLTTVLDMGNRDPQAQEAMTRSGLPALKRAGGPANAPGSRFVTKMGFDPGTAVDGPDDAARFVADRVAEGSDYVKILVEDPKIPGSKALSGGVVAALVVAAHEAGLQTVAHVVSADTMLTALQSGVDVVTHTALTSDLGREVEALLSDRRVSIIPTLTMMDGVRRAIGGKLVMRVLGRIRPSVRMDYAHAESTVRTFHSAGMPILVGTDANADPRTPFQPPHGESLHEELARLVAAGLTPVEALQGATSRAAEVFGLTDRGAVTAGRRADLVLVGGDPTADITATRDIRAVWIGGERVR